MNKYSCGIHNLHLKIIYPLYSLLYLSKFSLYSLCTIFSLPKYCFTSATWSLGLYHSSGNITKNPFFHTVCVCVCMCTQIYETM